MAVKLFLLFLVTVLPVVFAIPTTKLAIDAEPKENMKTAETLHLGLGSISVGVGGLGIGVHTGIGGPYYPPYYGYPHYHGHPHFYPHHF